MTLRRSLALLAVLSACSNTASGASAASRATCDSGQCGCPATAPVACGTQCCAPGDLCVGGQCALSCSTASGPVAACGSSCCQPQYFCN